MKKLMKARKDIGGITASVRSGELVYATKVGDYYSITPFGKPVGAIGGIPGHYLAEVETACELVE